MRNRVQLVGVLALVLSACGGGGAPPPLDELCPGADVTSDALNCGTCGHRCETPAHAQPACYSGSCGRTACDDGWVDLDPNVIGCESVGGVHALPEHGVVFWVFPVGAFGTATQSPLQLTSASYATTGVLGEAPVPANQAAALSSASYVNLPGYTAIQH